MKVKLDSLSDHTGHLALPANRLFSVKFSKTDPNMIIAGGWDKTIKIYDLRTKAMVNSISGPFLCGDSLDFEENVLLAASYTKQKD